MVVPVRNSIPEQAPDFLTLLEMFLATYGSEENTKNTYRAAITQFYRWVNDNGRQLSSLTSQDVIDFQTDLISLGQRHKVNTVNLYMSALRKFYGWLESNGIYFNIAASVKKKRKDNTFKSHLTVDESRRLLEYFRDVEPAKRILKNGDVADSLNRDTFNLIKARNYAMVNLMLRTGLRTIEVSRLTAGDIDEERFDRTILYVQGKGHAEKDQSNFVILSDRTYEPIREYFMLRRRVLPTDPVFRAEGYGCEGQAMSRRAIQNVVKSGFRAIGLSEKYTPHCLRHTTGVQILTHGGSVFDVQSVLRHSSPAISEIYLKSIERDERLRRAPDLLLDGVFD